MNKNKLFTLTLILLSVLHPYSNAMQDDNDKINKLVKDKFDNVTREVPFMILRRKAYNKPNDPKAGNAFCHFCGENYYQLGRLVKHFKCCQKNLFPKKCFICFDDCDNKKLAEHIKTSHEEEYNYFFKNKKFK